MDEWGFILCRFCWKLEIHKQGQIILFDHQWAGKEMPNFIAHFMYGFVYTVPYNVVGWVVFFFSAFSLLKCFFFRRNFIIYLFLPINSFSLALSTLSFIFLTVLLWVAVFLTIINIELASSQCIQENWAGWHEVKWGNSSTELTLSV